LVRGCRPGEGFRGPVRVANSLDISPVRRLGNWALTRTANRVYRQRWPRTVLRLCRILAGTCLPVLGITDVWSVRLVETGRSSDPVHANLTSVTDNERRLGLRVRLRDRGTPVLPGRHAAAWRIAGGLQLRTPSAAAVSPTLATLARWLACREPRCFRERKFPGGRRTTPAPRVGLSDPPRIARKSDVRGGTGLDAREPW